MNLSFDSTAPAGLDGLLSPLLLLAVAALLVVLAGWLLLRARRPVILRAAPAAAAPAASRAETAAKTGPGGPLRWLDSAMQALRYLSTRREWRYHSPWVLLLGQTGAGKSSLALSLQDGRREAMLLRERQLPLAGTHWHFCSGGVVIDPQGSLLEAEPDSAEGKRWQGILAAIDGRRPERPVDAVVLTIAADYLLSADAVALQALAERCYRQLWQLQKRFEFVLPVYLAISRCDMITGYTAFWRAQPAERRQVLWGWSNPSLNDHEEADTLARLVFEEMATCLRQLQLEAAAGSEQIAEADDFFLFPQRFGQLRRPLAGLLAVLLKPSSYHASVYFRGVYFSGSLAAAGTPSGAPTEQVDFANNLFVDKIFRERGLARPVRQSIWSRNRLIKRVQLGAVATFLLLFAALAWSTVRLEDQAEQLQSAVATVATVSRQSHASGRCVSRAAVSQVLEKISAIRTNMTYPAVPASWFDSRVVQQEGQWLAKKAFRDVLMPGLACRLEEEARLLAAYDPAQQSDTLLTSNSVGAARGAFRSYVLRVVELERQIAAFNELARLGEDDDAQRQALEFDALLLYAYQTPPPAALRHRDSIYYTAIIHVEYDKPLDLPDDFKHAVSARILQIATGMQKQLLSRIELGGTLLAELDRGNIETADGVAGFQDWLGWMRANWLEGAKSGNPCHSIGSHLGVQIRRLRERHGYPVDLERAAEEFDDRRCYQPARSRIEALRLAPKGTLFTARGSAYELNPAVHADISGFSVLQQLPIMRIRPRRTFNCQVALAGWRDEQLGQASTYLREYQQFSLTRKLNREDAAPLYDRLARRQLQAVLDDTLVEAQRTATTGGETDAEALVAERSAAFGRQIDPLLKLGEQLQGIGYADGANRFSRCGRDYAGDMLARIDTLADASRLYQAAPVPAPAAGMAEPGGVRKLYQIGDQAEVRDYLQNQRDRTAVLANYADPFVRFLERSGTLAAVDRPVGAGPGYWRGTLSELKRLNEGKDGTAALGELEGFFGKTLAVLDYDNCAALLGKAASAGNGLDLFSQRRRALAGQSQWRCQDRREAEAYERYRVLANRFNRDLAGRYPFADLAARDLDLTVARQFFRDYADERAPLHQAIAGLKPARWSEIRQFLDRLDKAADFFAPSLAAADASRPLRLEAGFRVLPKLERGAEQLINWRLAAGAGQLDYPGKGRQLDWPWGEAIVLDLAWASQSAWRPRALSRQADLQVDGVSASFPAMGQWGALRLIAAHRPQQAPAQDPLDPSRNILEFVVPLSDGGNPPQSTEARVYLALGLSVLDPRNQQAQALVVPREWPRAAPLYW
ncbi:hypothetical protein FNU76_20300 [Chitinimonas arctica]|uniref:Type VI secretion system component TssM1 N-terminal domain-containing protein n=1 Tax=Chitinimonas arctica TaxID=2594795 RepID=A0A516SK28_9NEIS|nr:type VI secretion system protein [Chitinimonas arctica]QDQ28511.1 hypothetical protein FNU76_20300 [Chitinimonas arctica]